MKQAWIIALVLVVCIALAEAHQPQVVGRDKAITVTEPEISKAYYGWVDDEVSFVIESEEEFELYVNILGPFAETKPNLDFKILKGDTIIEENKEHIWTYFYEPYGNDKYWMSDHVFNQTVSPGTYTVIVTGTDRYALAIGEAEKWGIMDSINAVINVIRIKFSWTNLIPDMRRSLGLA